MSYTRQTRVQRAATFGLSVLAADAQTMDIGQNLDTRRIVLIAGLDRSGADERVRAFEHSGMTAVAIVIGAETFGAACAAGPSVIILSFATEAALPLLQQLAHDHRTSRVPIIVTECTSEQMRARAEQTGAVAVFLGAHSASTLVSAARGLIAGKEVAVLAHTEFPAWCPQCEQRAGIPRSVSTVATAGTYVGLECQHCLQAWSVLRRGEITPLQRPEGE